MSETTKIKIQEKPDGVVLKNLCSTFLESIVRFYEDPKNQKRFKEWMCERR